MRIMRAVLVLLALPHAVSRNTTSVRATWLPVSVSVATPTDMQNLLVRLSASGVNRVYVDVWNNGRAFFNSSSVSRFAGTEALAADRLRWATDAAAYLDVGLEIVAWMEYGLMACFGAIAGAFAEAAQKKGWIIGSSGGWQWLDPTAATPLLVAMVNEIGQQYGVPVQLDDHFACPAALATCSASKMHAAARVMSSARPTHLSLSPAPAAFALQHYNVDWPSWAQEGLFDEVVPQLYTAASATFEDELHEAVATVPRALDFVAGIRADGSGQPTPWTELSRMLDIAVASQVGAAVWFTDGILNLYPEEFKAKWSRGAL